MLPPRLVGDGAAGREGGGVGGVLGVQAGVVVLDLVVVPRDDPREGGVARLQVGVAAVERVPVAVGRQRGDLGRVVGPDRSLAAVLVDVVAEEVHDVDVLGGQGAVRRVVAGRPVLAGREREAHGRRAGPGGGSGAGAADRAGEARRGEPVVEPGVGGEAGGVDVDGVGVRGGGDGGARGDDLGEGVVGGHLPADRHVDRWHAAAVQRVGRQAGPQDHRRGGRVAARHAEGERRTGQDRIGGEGPGGGQDRGCRPGGGGDGGAAGEEAAPIERARMVAHGRRSYGTTGVRTWRAPSPGGREVLPRTGP